MSDATTTTTTTTKRRRAKAPEGERPDGGLFAPIVPRPNRLPDPETLLAIGQQVMLRLANGDLLLCTYCGETGGSQPLLLFTTALVTGDPTAEPMLYSRGAIFSIEPLRTVEEVRGAMARLQQMGQQQQMQAQQEAVLRQAAMARAAAMAGQGQPPQGPGVWTPPR